METKFAMRAPPRRRVKGEEPEDQPVFLRKAFQMISTCPSDIGGWGPNGDTVLIKDVKQFSEKVIPTAYKHNNFSSFVRQLNFYGFRKIKTDSTENSNYWEFRHPQFIKDKPHLLSEIKRSVHFESPNVHEVSELKSQVSSLQDKLAALNGQVDKLTDMMAKAQVKEESPSKEIVYVKAEPVDSQKKRKLELGGPIQSDASLLATSVPLVRMLSSDSSTWAADGPDPLDNIANILDATPASSNMDWDNLAEMDFFGLNNEETTEELQSEKNITEKAESIVMEEIRSTGTAIDGVQSIVSKLSPDLQGRFIDKLAEVMGSYLQKDLSRTVEVVHQNVPSVNESDVSLISPASQSATASVPSKPIYHLPSGGKAPEIALPLATAAISAFVISNMQALSVQQHRHALPSSETCSA